MPSIKQEIPIQQLMYGMQYALQQYHDSPLDQSSFLSHIQDMNRNGVSVGICSLSGKLLLLDQLSSHLLERKFKGNRLEGVSLKDLMMPFSWESLKD